MKDFTHINHNGESIMVDVTSKEPSYRIAKAEGKIFMSEECFLKIQEHGHKKGDVLGVATTAGIMGAKKNSELIPLCHNIPLTNCEISFCPLEDRNGYICTSIVKCVGVTGVEMEALTSVSIALLTVYDMCKAIDKRMIITDIHLLTKSGGKSGEFVY